MDLSKYTKPQIDGWLEILNLTDDEEVVFKMLARKRSRVEIADALSVSMRTVDNRIKDIRLKMNSLKGGV